MARATRILGYNLRHPGWQPVLMPAVAAGVLLLVAVALHFHINLVASGEQHLEATPEAAGFSNPMAAMFLFSQGPVLVMLLASLGTAGVVVDWINRHTAGGVVARYRALGVRVQSVVSACTVSAAIACAVLVLLPVAAMAGAHLFSGNGAEADLGRLLATTLVFGLAGVGFGCAGGVVVGSFFPKWSKISAGTNGNVSQLVATAPVVVFAVVLLFRHEMDLLAFGGWALGAAVFLAAACLGVSAMLVKEKAFLF